MASPRRRHVRLTQFDELALGDVDTTATPDSVRVACDQIACHLPAAAARDRLFAALGALSPDYGPQRSAALDELDPIAV
jgi:hypothetical protein